MKINYYKDKVCLNVLASNLKNAQELYDAGEKYVLIGVLSSNYGNVDEAVKDMQDYQKLLNGNLSVGLGGGNPAQWKTVSDISRKVKANHFNQIFSAVGYNRACVDNEDAHINALVSPTGQVGKVKISTGPLSKEAPDAIVPIETAIAMVKEMGGNAIKFFPMNGLSCKDELMAVAKSCADNDFVLEPTGGIDLYNFEEILQLILDAGVKKVIPHVYSSIIDKETGETKVEDLETLMEIIKKVVV